MKYKILNKTSIFILMFAYASSSWSHSQKKEVKVLVNLKEIIAVKPSEKYGDEVYFSVTQYSDQKKPKQFRIPAYPNHWQSKNLEKIKNINLWQGSLGNNEFVQLMISLIEQDSPPFIHDDHLGSTKVTLKNVKGKLQINWEIPQLKDQPDVRQIKKNTPFFILRGSNFQYRVSFEVIKKLK